MSENKYVVEYTRPENERAGTHLVLMLHGYGSQEYDLLSLAAHLPQEGFTYASMRAPQPVGTQFSADSTGAYIATDAIGYQWYPLNQQLESDQRAIEQAEAEFEGQGYGIFKPAVAESVIELLRPIPGTIVFFTIMFLFFQAIFTWAAPFQDAVEGGFSALGELVHGWLDESHPLLAGLLGDGLIGGVGAVLTFVPQIIIMFLIIAFLEGVGYMSRAAFLMDRIMSRAGLEGRKAQRPT